LEQGLPVALSVYGELEAWQTGFQVLEDLGYELSDVMTRISALPLNHDWENLELARSLMLEYNKAYRADRLPPNPWFYGPNYPPARP
jgi:hypothetical protein